MNIRTLISKWISGVWGGRKNGPNGDWEEENYRDLQNQTTINELDNSNLIE